LSRDVFEHVTLATAIGAACFAALAVVGVIAQSKISADTERRQLRAYVFVSAASLQPDGQKLHLLVDIKNSGQTPAYDLITKFGLEFDNPGGPSKLKALDSVAMPVAPATVAPGGNMVIRLDNDLTNYPDVLPAWRGGRLIVSVAGQVQYRDAFERKWILDIRMRNSAQLVGDHWIMQPTEQGNGEHQQ
jgi:hypothetical protein